MFTGRHRMILTRRQMLQMAGLSPLAGWVTSAQSPAMAQERVFRHGETTIEPLKYPAGFSHFDYVNPKAPKGGRVRLATLGSFDSINPC